MAYAALTPCKEMQAKVNRRDGHKEDTDHLNGDGIKIANTGIMGRETANGYSRETVTDRIKQIHSC